jgi:hypothetical protein
MAHQQSDNACAAATPKAKDHVFTSCSSFKK